MIGLENLQKAANNGDPEAQYQLGQKCEFGHDLPLDHPSAAAWYRKAAEQGHTSAQYALALLYEHGRGVGQDFEEAFRWYHTAAEKGDAWAQNNLGFLYSHGKGVNADPVEAIRWYKKAAKQGHFHAQFNMASKFASGSTGKQGLQVDLVEAWYWFSLAGQQTTALNKERVRHALETLEEHMDEAQIATARARLNPNPIPEA